MSGTSYVYAEDSQLMGEALSLLDGGERFLEIGVGNGGNLEIVSDKFNLVVGTDIAKIRQTRHGKTLEFIIADRATCFRESIFDVVAFNPPYVPSESIVDKTVDGGPFGMEVPLEFLKSALEVIKKSGKILILLSSEDSLELFQVFCEERGLMSRKLVERKLFFECLSVFELTIREVQTGRR